MKPQSTCSILVNSDEDYDNLISIYYFLKDTATQEKLLLEKIKMVPTVDPNILDYIGLSKFYLAQKKWELAKKYCKQAFALDNKNADVLLEMAAIEYIDGNNEKAMEYINQVYTFEKEKPELYLLYGAISLQKNDLLNAYSLFKIAQQKINRQWIQKDLLDNFFEMKK